MRVQIDFKIILFVKVVIDFLHNGIRQIFEIAPFHKSPIDLDTSRESEFLPDGGDGNGRELEIKNIEISVTYNDTEIIYSNDWLSKTKLFDNPDGFYLSVNKAKANDNGLNTINPLDEFTTFFDSFKITSGTLSIQNDINSSPGVELVYNFSEDPRDTSDIVPDGNTNTFILDFTIIEHQKLIEADGYIQSFISEEIIHRINIKIEYK